MRWVRDREATMRWVRQAGRGGSEVMGFIHIRHPRRIAGGRITEGRIAGAIAIAVVACAAIAAMAAMATLASGAGQSAVSGERAQAARTLNGTDTAHLHLIHQDETLLYEEGPATGSLPGHMRAQLTIGSIYTGRCTIYTAGGTITGRGTATPHGSGRYQSFHGSLTITGGTGRYAHVHGRTELYGTFDRRTFAVVVQTTGNLSY